MADRTRNTRSVSCCRPLGVWTALNEAFDKYPVELNQTPNYWELMRRAHIDAMVLRLGHPFDPHPTAISLGNLLRTMKDNVAAPQLRSRRVIIRTPRGGVMNRR